MKNFLWRLFFLCKKILQMTFGLSITAMRLIFFLISHDERQITEQCYYKLCDLYMLK